jgi:uncharacterized protein with GYD domain
MAKYILLMNWTEQGIKSIKDSPKRLEAARRAGKKDGIKMGDFFMTMGAYDMVLTVDAPDDAALARYVLQVAGQGNVRSTTLKAFPEAEYKTIVASV